MDGLGHGRLSQRSGSVHEGCAGGGDSSRAGVAQWLWCVCVWGSRSSVQSGGGHGPGAGAGRQAAGGRAGGGTSVRAVGHQQHPSHGGVRACYRRPHCWSRSPSAEALALRHPQNCGGRVLVLVAAEVAHNCCVWCMPAWGASQSVVAESMGKARVPMYRPEPKHWPQGDVKAWAIETSRRLRAFGYSKVHP